MACFTPKQVEMVTEGLLEAFPTRVSLANMLAAVANTPKVRQFPRATITRRLLNINQIAGEEADMEKVVFNVIQTIQAATLCHELVKTAHEWNPFVPSLETLHWQLMPIKTVDPAQDSDLERLLTITKQQFLNPVIFAQRFGAIRYQVCRIEIGAKEGSNRKAHATGFLVGANVVLTNHHVIEPVLTGQVDVSQFVFGFDRVDWEDGTQTFGPTYGLHTPSQRDQWLLAMSDKNELDYALLRLDTDAGELPIIESATATDAAKRGWLSLSATASQTLATGAPLIIVQHPDGLPLRMDLRIVDALSPTRVNYTTNTMKGSSGSPCFDRELRLCALHRGTDGSLNQGVPVAAILADLEQKAIIGQVAVA